MKNYYLFLRFKISRVEMEAYPLLIYGSLLFIMDFRKMTPNSIQYSNISYQIIEKIHYVVGNNEDHQ